MNPNHLGRVLAPTFLALLLATTLSAQDEPLDQRIQRLAREYDEKLERLRTNYEHRIVGLESEIQELRGEVEHLSDDVHGELEDGIEAILEQDPGHAGHDHGIGAHFGSSGNPAIGVVGDFIFTASTLDDDFDLYNQFILRGVEVSLFGSVDDQIDYYVALFFDEEDVDLEEAYAVARDILPVGLALRFGRFNLDHGKTSPLHEHELRFVDKPGVIQEYLGGTLRGTGLELHRGFDTSRDDFFRVSVGIANSPEYDAHAIGGPLAGMHDHHDDDEELSGKRDLGNFAYTARVAGVFAVGDETRLEAGVNLLFAPERRTHFEDLTGTMEYERDLAKRVVTIDFTLQSIDTDDGSGFVVQTELLFNQEEFGDPADGSVFEQDSFGFHIFGEYHLDWELSFGAAFDCYEKAEGGSTSWDVGAFVTWQWSTRNRFRLEARWYDDTSMGEDYLLVMIQWTTFLGAHGHPLPW